MKFAANSLENIMNKPEVPTLIDGIDGLSPIIKVDSLLESNVEVVDNHSLDTRILKDLTLVVYFDDPILPYAFKEVINMPANKELLRLYEASLPSWTVVLA